MDAVTCYGVEFPVSVWMRRVGGDSKTHTLDLVAPHTQTPPPRVIVVIEPVERSSALFSLDSDHMIVSCDPWFACMFGFQDSLEMIGRRVTELIPSLTLPHTAGEEEVTMVCGWEDRVHSCESPSLPLSLLPSPPPSLPSLPPSLSDCFQAGCDWSS